jgi:hypothetical protein
MIRPHRKISMVFCCLAGLSLAGPDLIKAWQSPHPLPRPSPNAPINQNAPLGLDGRPAPPESGKPSVDQQNQQEIRMEVQRLYAMATELKDEVDRTNADAVLSMSVVKRAQEIEKLAKEIRSRAKR